MQQNKHTTHLKRDRICKDGNRLLRTKRILFIYLFMVRWVYKEEDHTISTRNILCQQAVDSVPNELFSQCLQSSLSICQVLLFHKLAKLGYYRIPFPVCPSSISILLDCPFEFLIQAPSLSSSRPLRVFNLTSTFLFFEWFKLPFRVFTLNLFLFPFLAKIAFFRFSTLTSLSSCGLKHNTS